MMLARKYVVVIKGDERTAEWLETRIQATNRAKWIIENSNGELNEFDVLVYHLSLI